MILILLIGFFVVLFVILSYALTQNANNKSLEGGSHMIKPSWTIRNIYLYLVCFTTLVMMIVGTVQAIDATYGLVNPAPVHPEVYKETYPIKPGEVLTNEEKEKLEARNKVNQEYQIKQNEYYQKKRLFENGVLFFVALPVYLYHWRLIKRNSEDENKIKD